MKNSPGVTFLFKILWLSVIVAAFTCSVGLFITSHKALKLHGPSGGTALPNGEVVLMAGSQIFRLDSSGQLLERLPTEQAAIGYSPSDIEAMPSGDLLIADPGRGNVQRCDAKFKKCVPVIRIKAGHATPLSNDYQFDYDAKRKQLIFAFPEDKELAIYGLSGQHLATFDALDLKRPEDVFVMGDHIYVADAGAKSVIRWKMTSGFELTEKQVFPMENNVAKEGRVHPMRLFQDREGLWWVLLAKSSLSQADIIKFDSEFNAVGRIQLGEQNNPVGIFSDGFKIIVLDAENYAALEVSLAGEFLDDFAGPNAWDLFAKYAAQYDENKRTRQMVWCAIALTLSGFAICIYLLMVRRLATEPDTEVPNATWFTPENKYLEFMPKIFWLFFAGFIMGSVWLLWMFGLSDGIVLVLFGNFLMYVTPSLFFMYMLQVAIHARVGIADGKIIVSNHLGDTATGIPEETIFDGTTIVIKNVAVTTKITGLGLVYEEQSFNEKFAPELEMTRRPGWWAMEVKLFKIVHPPTITTFMITLPLGILALLVYAANQ